MTCEHCGKELSLGCWPFCPHEYATPQIISDELTGGFVQENFGHEPEYFESKKRMLARADELGLRQKTPGDSYRGGFAVTSKTLADAAELLTRGTKTTETVTCKTATFTVTVLPATLDVPCS